MPHILIVEDDIAFGTMLQTWLRKKGFEVDKATSVGVAVKLLSSDKCVDLVLSDLRLPDHDGLRLLAWMRKSNINAPFIVMTNYAEVQNAVLAMKSGAADYIAKPVQPDILLQKINDAIKGNTANNTIKENAATAAKENKKPSSNNSSTSASSTKSSSSSTPRYIEGKSEASMQLYSYVELVAPTPMSVLILGASGTGKEYVAHRIHELSQRHDRPFFALDCGAIPRDVAASEFFGHKKGRFREDLYHRINEFTIYMPKLSERGTDLFLFADLFMRHANEELDRSVEGFDSAAAEMLASHSWPGNLRELNNVVKRAVLLTRGKLITTTELSMAMGPTKPIPVATLHDEDTERSRIIAALQQTNGNKAKAARLLGVDRKTIYNKIEKLGIEEGL